MVANLSRPIFEGRHYAIHGQQHTAFGYWFKKKETMETIRYSVQHDTKDFFRLLTHRNRNLRITARIILLIILIWPHGEITGCQVIGRLKNIGL